MATVTLGGTWYLGAVVAEIPGFAAIVNMSPDAAPSYAVQLDGGAFFVHCRDLTQARAALAAAGCNREALAGHARVARELSHACWSWPGQQTDPTYRAIAQAADQNRRDAARLIGAWEL